MPLREIEERVNIGEFKGLAFDFCHPLPLSYSIDSAAGAFNQSSQDKVGVILNLTEWWSFNISNLDCYLLKLLKKCG